MGENFTGYHPFMRGLYYPNKVFHAGSAAEQLKDDRTTKSRSATFDSLNSSAFPNSFMSFREGESYLSTDDIMVDCVDRFGQVPPLERHRYPSFLDCPSPFPRPSSSESMSSADGRALTPVGQNYSVRLRRSRPPVSSRYLSVKNQESSGVSEGGIVERRRLFSRDNSSDGDDVFEKRGRNTNGVDRERMLTPLSCTNWSADGSSDSDDNGPKLKRVSRRKLAGEFDSLLDLNVKMKRLMVSSGVQKGRLGVLKKPRKLDYQMDAIRSTEGSCIFPPIHKEQNIIERLPRIPEGVSKGRALLGRYTKLPPIERSPPTVTVTSANSE